MTRKRIKSVWVRLRDTAAFLWMHDIALTWSSTSVDTFNSAVRGVIPEDENGNIDTTDPQFISVGALTVAASTKLGKLNPAWGTLPK